MFCYDVVVCGGGPAGFIAAVAAARNGAKTALIEKSAYVGGMATAGLVAPISEFNKNDRRIIGGIPWEFAERLAALGGADLSYPIGNVPYDPELYKLAAQRLLLESGAELFLGCTLCGCSAVNNRIESVEISTKSGNFTIKGSVFIDATGDGELAFRAGAPFQSQPEAAELQPATLCFRLANVDTEHLESIEFRHHGTKYANARIRGILTELKAQGVDVPNFGGPWFHWAMRDGIVAVNMTRSPVDPEDIRQSALMECRLREDAFRFATLLKEHVPEFKDSYIVQTAAQAGWRESRRILGKHTLTAEEFLRHEVFPDTIALGAHPVDIHRAADSKQDVTFLLREGCVPYRSLVMEDFPNLIVAGRCISADRAAFASIRVQACAMAIGQAAGTAAAMSHAEKIPVNALDGARLRSALAQQGAIVE